MWPSVVVVVFLASLVAAQSEWGVVRGTVIDPSGAVLPGVTLTLTGPEKRTTVTDAHGQFVFIGLLSGEYQL
jgi:protocatechuate 3,4-dioxygenase beta subunit